MKYWRVVPHFDIKIFGTDIDTDATEQARRGVYPESSVESLEPELLNKYFTRKERSYQVSKFIRELVVFARQD